MNNNKISTKVLLSSLWLFALLNYLYCDLVGLMDSNLLNQYLKGKINGLETTQGFLLAATILIEIPIVMILFSRILKYRINRILNIVTGLFMTLVQASSLFAGVPTMYYVFCSILEITATVSIVWIAFKWKENNLSASE